MTFSLFQILAIDRMKWLVRDFCAVYRRNMLGGAACWRGCFALVVGGNVTIWGLFKRSVTPCDNI